MIPSSWWFLSLWCCFSQAVRLLEMNSFASWTLLGLSRCLEGIRSPQRISLHSSSILALQVQTIGSSYASTQILRENASTFTLLSILGLTDQREISLPVVGSKSRCGYLARVGKILFEMPTSCVGVPGFESPTLFLIPVSCCCSLWGNGSNTWIFSHSHGRPRLSCPLLVLRSPDLVGGRYLWKKAATPSQILFPWMVLSELASWTEKSSSRPWLLPFVMVCTAP